MDSADVVIVGGGIVGSAVAYFLSSDAAFQGRRIVLIERDPSYAEASTARSAGGLRQQFSTPENIAMSQFTLSLIRQLEAVFGPEADVGFREQGYLITGDPKQARELLAENVALQQSHGADIELLEAAELARRFPWIATRGRCRRRLRPVGRRLVRSAEPGRRCCAMRPRRAASPSLHDRVTGIEARARVEAVRLASGGRIACGALVNAAGPWAGELAALAGVRLPVEPRKRFVYVIDCREASGRAAPGAADRRSIGRVVPAGGSLLPVRQVSRGERGAAAPSTSTHIDHDFFDERGVAAAGARACRRSRASRW